MFFFFFHFALVSFHDVRVGIDNIKMRAAIDFRLGNLKLIRYVNEIVSKIDASETGGIYTNYIIG